MVDGHGCTAPIPLDAEEGKLLGRINGRRTQLGVPELVVSNELTKAAQRHARDMLANGTTGDIDSDGSSTATRVKDAGYPYAVPTLGWSTTAGRWTACGRSPARTSGSPGRCR